MKKYIKLIIILFNITIFLFFALITLASCGNDNHEHTYGEWIITKEATVEETGIRERTCSDCEYKEIEKIDKLNLYTIIWKDADGSILKYDENVVEGTIPIYDGPTPTKKNDETYTYTFAGWDKEIAKASKYETYTAIYYRNFIDYTVTFYDEDETTILSQQTYHYGDVIKDIPVPTKESDGKYIYEFSGWDKNIDDKVTENLTFKAKYNIEYEIVTNGDEITIKRYRGNENDIVIPSIVGDKKVTAIGESAFSYNKNITSIDIPEGVTSIGDEAFYSCNSLMKISIPNSIITIGQNLFSYDLEYNEYDNAYYLGNSFNPYLVMVKTKSLLITTLIIHKDCKIILDEAHKGCILVEIINNSTIDIVKGNSSNGGIALYAINVKQNGTSDIVNQDGYLFLKSKENEINYFFYYEGDNEKIILPNDFNGESYTIWGFPFHDFFQRKYKLVIPDNVVFELSNFYGAIFEYVVTSKKEVSEYTSGIHNSRVEMFGINRVYFSKSYAVWLKLNSEYEVNSYFYSDTKPADTTHNYWHYVDGEPTPW